MLERCTHKSDRERLVAELLEAACACGRSLQKDLALPRVAGMCAELTAKTLLSKSVQGIEYLGYRVYPHHLHPCSRAIGALKARLDFFKHLFWPDRFALCQRPMRGVWQSLALNGELAPPLAPDWLLLKRMEATINSYYGIMGHAQSYNLRKSLYHKHFGPLRDFFLPADAAYSAMHVKKRFLYQ
jgi:hypothetical protein